VRGFSKPSGRASFIEVEDFMKFVGLKNFLAQSMAAPDSKLKSGRLEEYERWCCYKGVPGVGLVQILMF